MLRFGKNRFGKNRFGKNRSRNVFLFAPACALLFVCVALPAFGQLPAQTPVPGGAVNQVLGGQAAGGQVPGGQLGGIRPDYVLGPNDQVLIRVPQAEEINERPFRIATDGFIDLPVVGRVRADGLTVQALETEVATRLREFIRNPLVSITVTQFRSEPVFFVGAFRAPGIYTLQGRRSLIEMLTAVGGILPNASRRIKITRRAEYSPIPLPNVVVDAAKKISTVEISLDSLTQEINPAEDIVLQAYDVIDVERAERVYVNGEVAKVSSIELGERSSISITQALTEAGGMTQFAIRDKIRVLRPVLGTNRRAEMDIDMKRVYEGKDVDFPLLPNDVVYVPRSGNKSVLVPTGTGLLASIPYIVVSLLLKY